MLAAAAAEAKAKALPGWHEPQPLLLRFEQWPTPAGLAGLLLATAAEPHLTARDDSGAFDVRPMVSEDVVEVGTLLAIEFAARVHVQSRGSN